MNFEDFGFELNLTFVRWYNDAYNMSIDINTDTMDLNCYDLYYCDTELLNAKSEEEIVAYLQVYFRKQKIKNFLK